MEAEAGFKKAELEARGNLVLSKSITMELIRYLAVQRWKGELPKMVGGNVVPTFDVSGDLK